MSDDRLLQALNALTPKAPPNPCCADAANLSAFIVDAHEPGGLVSGYRRCGICQRRHFFLRDSRTLGLEGGPTP